MPLDSSVWDAAYKAAPIKIVIFHEDNSRSNRIIFPYKTIEQLKNHYRKSIRMLEEINNRKTIRVAQYYRNADNKLVAEWKAGKFYSHENLIL